MALRAHIWKLVGIGQLSNNKTQFKANFKKVFNLDKQMELFEDIDFND